MRFRKRQLAHGEIQSSSMRGTGQLEFIISQAASNAAKDRKLAAKKSHWLDSRQPNGMQTREAQNYHLCRMQ
jgi:hypothetical protein